MLIEHETLALENPDVVRNALTDFRRSTSLEFSDCLILNLARSTAHTPLGSFDRRLTRLEGAEAPS